MRKKPIGIIIITFLDLLAAFYFGINAILWQASKNSWKDIIIYDWPIFIYGFIITLPLIWISILTLRLKPSGRRLNIVLCISVILMGLTRMRNNSSSMALITISFPVVIIFYLMRSKIKELFSNK